jgi:succinate-acetate transporter protein
MKRDNINKFLAAGITSVSDVQNTFSSIVAKAFGFFWIVAVAMLLWAAFLFLSAGDNEEKVTKAKKILLYAVIAAAVALLANGINPIVTNILNSGA